VKKLAHFEQKRAYALFCPVGRVSFVEVAELMSRAVLCCRRKKIKKLLIDSTRLPELKIEGLTQRIFVQSGKL
jgi:hypothetical protein